MRFKRAAACPCCPSSNLACVQVLNPCFGVLHATPFAAGGAGGVAVEVRDAGGTLAATGTTDNYGKACFAGLAAGSYTATALAPTARWAETSTTLTVAADGSGSARIVMPAAAGYHYYAGCDRPIPDALTLTTVWGPSAFGYTDSAYTFTDQMGVTTTVAGWYARVGGRALVGRMNAYGYCVGTADGTEVDVILTACGGGVVIRTPLATCCPSVGLLTSPGERCLRSPGYTVLAPAFPGQGPSTGYRIPNRSPGASPPPPPQSCDPFSARVYYDGTPPPGLFAYPDYRAYGDRVLWDDGLGNSVPYLTISE